MDNVTERNCECTREAAQGVEKSRIVNRKNGIMPRNRECTRDAPDSAEKSRTVNETLRATARNLKTQTDRTAEPGGNPKTTRRAGAAQTQDHKKYSILKR
jgi:hypothetical protein